MRDDMVRRSDVIDSFLADAGWAIAARVPMGADWSTRRYERLTAPDGTRAILMDAAGEGAAQVPPFIRICGLLRDAGLSAPDLFAQAPPQGLLLLEDFGDDSFAALLERGDDPWPLYAVATDVLAHLHDRFDPASAPDLPCYGLPLFTAQVALFADAYMEAADRPLAAAGRAALDAAWVAVLEPVLDSVPVSLLLRDYHPGNLMWLPGRPGVRACGLLDVQDGGIGPVSYDLLSLLQDARRDVPDTIQATMIDRYLLARPGVRREAFLASYAVMGAMRHARILGRVAQLAAGGGKARQLAFLSRVWRQFRGAIAHPLLAPLQSFMDEHLPPDGAVAHILGR
ncbi:aminoglycoside phosphotransferase family protein [Niveispirillum fermenti]|uniref:aminoglycoside phosphotransferase family protein n=1 Tax=Niveispirillum fermenti TaxID=1233113 RepID=UPI003A83DB73